MSSRRFVHALGSSQIEVSQLGAALEKSLKKIGFKREYDPDADVLFCEVCISMSGGAWLFIRDDDRPRREVAAALAEQLTTELTLFSVQAPDEEAASDNLSYKAWRVSPSGELEEFQRAEFDTQMGEDVGGAIEDRLEQILDALVATELEGQPVATLEQHTYSRSPMAANPRLGKMVEMIRKAGSYEVSPEGEGRFVVRIVLPDSGRQMSYVTGDELELIEKHSGLSPTRDSD